jgi:hypothetical protein
VEYREIALVPLHIEETMANSIGHSIEVEKLNQVPLVNKPHHASRNNHRDNTISKRRQLSMV